MLTATNQPHVAAAPRHAQPGVQPRGGGEAAADDGGIPAHPALPAPRPALRQPGGAQEVSQAPAGGDTRGANDILRKLL